MFTGDARYEPATVNLAIKVGVKVSAALSGYYQSIRISVTQYRVYHHTATLKDAVAITPDKSRADRQASDPEVRRQRLARLHHDRLRDGQQVGQGHRVQQAQPDRPFPGAGRFPHTRAKDTTNVSTDGGWLYYEVTK